MDLLHGEFSSCPLSPVKCCRGRCCRCCWVWPIVCEWLPTSAPLMTLWKYVRIVTDSNLGRLNAALPAALVWVSVSALLPAGQTRCYIKCLTSVVTPWMRRRCCSGDYTSHCVVPSDSTEGGTVHLSDKFIALWHSIQMFYVFVS